MATTAARGKGKGKGRGKGKPAAAKAKSNGGEGKRAAGAQQTEALIKKVVAARKKDTSYAEIGSDLGITPGKAQFCMMLHAVAEGEVPKVAQTAKAIVAARKKADEHSSWGWLAARTGLAEGKVKKLAEEAGAYEKGKENIAAKRAGSKPAKATATKATGKGKGKGKGRGR